MALTPDGALTDPAYRAMLMQYLLNCLHQTAPAVGAGTTPATSILVKLAANTVGATQATIAHGLSYTPNIYSIVMTSAGTVWRSAATDAPNIYLTADSASRTCDIWLGY